MVKQTIGFPVGRAIRTVIAFLIVNPIKSTGAPNSAFLNGVGKYIVNILITIDQLFNGLFLGDPDETISSRLGKMIRSNEQFFFTRLVADFLSGLDPNHCEKSIEEDEGDNAVVE